ncbi:MAG: hypothetical protein EAZ94_00360 [Oscillatoriales cyanobacterium]|nr:MAG: hypothetical protein EAZ94_00360 [Oscillatoriales cyanobacterium]TAE28437.1 MAG: hypothetical protein EAZ93_03320 [Oscillatoriales cyanobacterium]
MTKIYCAISKEFYYFLWFKERFFAGIDPLHAVFFKPTFQTLYCHELLFRISIANRIINFLAIGRSNYQLKISSFRMQSRNYMDGSQTSNIFRKSHRN